MKIDCFVDKMTGGRVARKFFLVPCLVLLVDVDVLLLLICRHGLPFFCQEARLLLG